ncbi:MAG TPA: ABC transporter ATP-binding protein [Gaiellaceae bacterium]|nr:ABC transporter ATP-binding protein [Gaiellaceae bacterium]
MLPEALLAEPAQALQRSTARPRLELHQISKRWGTTGAVLDNVDLELRESSLVALVGRNGVGKTTLLRIAAGLIAPDAGRVALDGFDPFADRREYQRRLGFVSAGQGGLYARLTVRQHLEYWSRLAFIPRRERAAAVAAAIERVAMAAKADARVDRLSAGQRQRVRIAMTFMHGPSLVLLDEPHTSLDDDGVSAVEALVRDALEGGASVVWCAPSVPALGLAFDEVYRVENGKVSAA